MIEFCEWLGSVLGVTTVMAINLMFPFFLMLLFGFAYYHDRNTKFFLGAAITSLCVFVFFGFIYKDHEHEWAALDCKKPMTCLWCGKKKGKPVDHSWEEPTCTVPKRCNRCYIQEGESLGGHQWIPASYSEPETCKVCGMQTGKSLEEQEKAKTNYSYNFYKNLYYYDYTDSYSTGWENYDEGYDDVYYDREYDQDRYETDPEYANGVDDAMDEWEESGWSDDW